MMTKKRISGAWFRPAAEEVPFPRTYGKGLSPYGYKPTRFWREYPSSGKRPSEILSTSSGTQAGMKPRCNADDTRVSISSMTSNSPHGRLQGLRHHCRLRSIGLRGDVSGQPADAALAYRAVPVTPTMHSGGAGVISEAPDLERLLDFSEHLSEHGFHWDQRPRPAYPALRW